MAQGNFLCSHLKQPKISLLSSFLYRIRKQEGRTGPAWGGWYQWEEEEGREMVKEGEYGANTMKTCM
jgi:hypothetical protein